MLTPREIVLVVVLPLAMALLLGWGAGRWKKLSTLAGPLAIVIAGVCSAVAVFGPPRLVWVPSQTLWIWVVIVAGAGALLMQLLSRGVWRAALVALAASIAGVLAMTRWKVINNQWSAADAAGWAGGLAIVTTLLWLAIGVAPGLLRARNESAAAQDATIEPPKPRLVDRFVAAGPALSASGIAGLGSLVLVFAGSVAEHGKVSGALAQGLLGLAVMAFVRPTDHMRRAAMAAASASALPMAALWIDGHYAGYLHWGYGAAMAAGPIAAAIIARLWRSDGLPRALACITAGFAPTAVAAAVALAQVRPADYLGE